MNSKIEKYLSLMQGLVHKINMSWSQNYIYSACIAEEQNSSLILLPDTSGVASLHHKLYPLEKKNGFFLGVADGTVCLRTWHMGLIGMNNKEDMQEHMQAYMDQMLSNALGKEQWDMVRYLLSDMVQNHPLMKLCKDKGQWIKSIARYVSTSDDSPHEDFSMMSDFARFINFSMEKDLDDPNSPLYGMDTKPKANLLSPQEEKLFIETALIRLCKSGKHHMMKILLTQTQLVKENKVAIDLHAQDEQIFKNLYRWCQQPMLQYLVDCHGFTVTPAIEQFINENPVPHALQVKALMQASYLQKALNVSSERATRKKL